MKCPKCGADNYDNAVYCTSCGEALQGAQDNNKQPQQPYSQQPQQPGYQQPYQQPQQPPMYQQPMYQQPAPMPQVNNYLVWSILVTIFCCLPFGIAAIVSSSKVNTLLAQGNYQGALDASKKAKTWCIVGAILGVVWFILVCILYGAGILTLESYSSIYY